MQTNTAIVIQRMGQVKRHEDQVMAGLMILPVLLLVIGLAGGLVVLWKNRKAHA